MQINKDYVQTRYNVTRAAGRKITYIIIHNTATTAPAINNVKYFGSGNRNASADFFIDMDGSIYQFNKDYRNYYTWQVGDGNGKYGITNKNSIGIELVSAGTRFTEKQIESLNFLTRSLMNELGISAGNVKRHYDASRKRCPAAYIDSESWNYLHARITKEDDDMSAQDVWTYPIGEGEAGKNDMPAWARLGWINHDSAALYATLCRTDDAAGDGTNGDIYTRMCYVDKRVRDLTEITIPAMETAIKVLAETKNVDPDEIAAEVSEAVKQKLESIEIRFEAM